MYLWIFWEFSEPPWARRHASLNELSMELVHLFYDELSYCRQKRHITIVVLTTDRNNWGYLTADVFHEASIIRIHLASSTVAQPPSKTGSFSRILFLADRGASNVSHLVTFAADAWKTYVHLLHCYKYSDCIQRNKSNKKVLKEQ